MARRELSKKLIPLPAEIQQELRAKHKMPQGFFYHNEKGELFCAITKSESKNYGDGTTRFVTGLYQLNANTQKLRYKGYISLTGKGKRRTAYVRFYHSDAKETASGPPPETEQGRQASRMIFEEAFKLGATRIVLEPSNMELKSYCRSEFGFKKIKHPVRDLFAMPKKERKIPKPRKR